jgi:DNA mismatch repair ATPase MutS
MKAFLLYRDRDFNLEQALPWNENDLVQDLELNPLFNAMACEDKFVAEVVKKVILTGTQNEVDTILYRQAILKDCIDNVELIREIYDLTVQTINSEKEKFWGIFRDYPEAILHRSIEVLQMFVEMLEKMRGYADQNSTRFESEGFVRLFRMLQQELNDDYFAIIQYHLQKLRFRGGVLISAELGTGNKGKNYILRKPADGKRRWTERLLAQTEDWIEPILSKKPISYTFVIADRDEAGSRALTDLNNRGLNHAANALAQSNDHILSFFKMLRTELAFYIGCLNLNERLTQMSEPICFPTPEPPDECIHVFKGLYDISLALTMKDHVVGNDLDTRSKNLVIITGANQGGKSTFLRSIGQSQLMLQSGMFVPAEVFRGNLVDCLFTHYKREEDSTMSSGKLDEELSRMNEIVSHITSTPMLLFNESFAATNEREGSEIARQIVTALLEKSIQVFYVTHLYEFAHRFYEKRMSNTQFLRAERLPDGSRTFKIREGEPLETSYGEDLYQKIFTEVNQPHL